jgi:hypothetical protein
VRDIRDVHAQPEVAVGQFLDRDRVVEIARVFPIDGDGDDVAKIGSATDVAIRYRPAEPHRFGHRFVGVRVGDTVLADDDLGVDARCVDVAQHLGDASDGAARGGRPARELGQHHLARRRAAFLAGRHEDVHEDAPIERHDVPHAIVATIVAADNPGIAPLEDADDASFDAPAFLDAFDADDHAVAVHCFVEMDAGHVNVAARVERTLGRDEAVAGRMGLQPADIEVHLFRQAEPMASNLDEIAGGDERLDVTFERRPVVAGNFEHLQQLAHAGGMVNALPHQREDLIA